MRLFAPLYEKTLAWSRHPRAPTFLGTLSFFEAIIFPVPPEVMLAPMTLAQPVNAWRYATISLFWSTLKRSSAMRSATSRSAWSNC